MIANKLEGEEALCSEKGDLKYSKGLRFISNRNGTCYVSGIGTCTDTDVVIPNTSPDGDTVTRIGNGAFSRCTGLTSVTIPDSVKRIGNGAFYYCTGLTSVKNNYKAFILTKKGELKCRDKCYQIGKMCACRGELELCENGIHYCTNLFDIFNYYSGEYGKDFVIGICDVSKENVGKDSDSKRCARWIIPKKILTREEVINIMNNKIQREKIKMEIKLHYMCTETRGEIKTRKEKTVEILANDFAVKNGHADSELVMKGKKELEKQGYSEIDFIGDEL